MNSSSPSSFSKVLKLITIDGPSASGKSSVSREVAKRLGWSWVSTGVFYRGIAYVALTLGVSADDEPGLLKILNTKDWSVEMATEQTIFRYMKGDVTPKLRQEEIGAVASQVSTISSVRQALLSAQQDCFIRSPQGLVAEGRDCGTVVFPQASLKIYLTAKTTDRARRRAKEEGKTIKETKAYVSSRERTDQGREAAPLQVPPGSTVVDTTSMPLESVIVQVLGLAQKRFL